MSKIPPPSEPKANKKEPLVSVRLSDEEMKRFEETVNLYRSRHKSRHPKIGITYSGVLRAAIETLRDNLEPEIGAEEIRNEPTRNLDCSSGYIPMTRPNHSRWPR